METGYTTVFWFLVISVLTVPLLLGIGALLRPKGSKSRQKLESYECGEEPVGSPWVQFNIRFYVIAIIFLIFDVEVATVFPTAVAYKNAILTGNGGAALIKIFLFVALLLVGLVYSWARGDLDWVKGITRYSRRRGTE